MVPDRIHYHGDKNVAGEYVGFGKKCMSKLKTSMSFQKLKDDKSFIRLDNGIEVTCTSSFGINNVHVYAPPVVEEEELVGGCVCGPYFAEGVVVGVHPVSGYVEPCQLYTVDICQGSNRQITVDNCVSYDFDVFALGDRVAACISLRDFLPLLPAGTQYPGFPCMDDYYASGGTKDWIFGWQRRTTRGYMGNVQGYTLLASSECTELGCDSVTTEYFKICGSDLTPESYPLDEYPCFMYMCDLVTTSQECCRLMNSSNGFFYPMPTTAPLPSDMMISSTMDSMHELIGTTPPVDDPSVSTPLNVQIMRLA